MSLRFPSVDFTFFQTLVRSTHGMLLLSSRVSRGWNALLRADQIWEHIIRRDFHSSDPTTLSGVLRTSASPVEAYKRLNLKHICTRCARPFTDGANSPTECNFHSGLLFSGGLMNGAALRFTCCNRHSAPAAPRDANGCRASYHVTTSSNSYWAPEGRLGATPNIYKPGDSCPAGVADCRDSFFLQYSHYTKSPLEWHPNQRPGLIELPSRLLLQTNV